MLCAICCAVTLVFLLLIQKVDNLPISSTSVWQWCVLYLGAGFGVNAPKALLFLLATEECLEVIRLLKEIYSSSASKLMGVLINIEAGSLSGLIGLCAQFGASMSGYLVGVKLLPFFGWSALAKIQIYSTVILIGLLILLSTVSRRERKVIKED